MLNQLRRSSCCKMDHEVTRGASRQYFRQGRQRWHERGWHGRIEVAVRTLHNRRAWHVLRQQGLAKDFASFAVLLRAAQMRADSFSLRTMTHKIAAPLRVDPKVLEGQEHKLFGAPRVQLINGGCDAVAALGAGHVLFQRLGANADRLLLETDLHALLLRRMLLRQR